MMADRRNWERYAQALDRYLGGERVSDIAEVMGVSKQRAYQMVAIGGQQLAFRVFRGVPRPMPKHSWVTRCVDAGALPYGEP